MQVAESEIMTTEERTRAIMQAIIVSRQAKPLGFLSAVTRKENMSLSACAEHAISVTAPKERRVTLTDVCALTVFAMLATESVDMTKTLSAHGSARVSTVRAYAHGFANSYSKRTAVSAPARSAQKPILLSSLWNTSAGAAGNIARRLAVTPTQIFADGDFHKRATPCFAGIAMRAVASPAFALTSWSNPWA